MQLVCPSILDERLDESFSGGNVKLADALDIDGGHKETRVRGIQESQLSPRMSGALMQHDREFGKALYPHSTP